LIEVRDLCKTFHDRKKGDISAVRNVSFQCAPGHVFGLLGRNGAGKTTTLRMLATILAPTSGTAVIDGLDVTEKPGEVRRRIGYLSGDTKLYDRLTGRELLEYFGELSGMTQASIEGRIAELQVTFHLGDFLDRRVGKMSTGMKQRLSLARVVLHDPPVLIFDEPVNGLDPEGIRWIRNLMKSLAAEGRTVFVSSHLIAEMALTAERLIVIGAGRLLADTTVAELSARHTTLEDAFLALTSGSAEFRATGSK